MRSKYALIAIIIGLLTVCAFLLLKDQSAKLTDTPKQDTPEQSPPANTPDSQNPTGEKPVPDSQVIAHDTTLADLGTRPDWTVLDIWQETITREDFERLLTEVYTVGDRWKSFITINADHAVIRTDTRKPDAVYKLKFSHTLSEASPDRNWSGAGDLPPASKDKPLAGIHIAIDPGHIGGDTAKLEERWFKIGDNKPVMEGNMTLTTAKIIKKQLKELGAKVYLIRKDNKPVNPHKLEYYRDAAVAKARTFGQLDEDAITRIQNRFYYRTGEIRERARRVNLAFRPDLVLCLHYNAVGWADPNNPRLSDKNHYHVLLHGALTSSEIAHDDERFEMLVKILQRSHDEEQAIGSVMSKALAHYTKLPAYEYEAASFRARKIKGADGLWARNLLANRLYQCPVIFLEPYVMNNKEVHDRVQLGDYQGTKDINGVQKKSIYREYAEAVTEALKAYYLNYRITYDPNEE